MVPTFRSPRKLGQPLVSDNRIIQTLFLLESRWRLKVTEMYMRRLWKLVSVGLFATGVALGVIGFSMFWWPNIPSSPRPEEGRIYPLNNHGRYTYMNSSEHLIQELAWVGTPVLLFTFAAIQYLVDPFDYLRDRRRYGSLPSGFR